VAAGEPGRGVEDAYADFLDGRPLARERLVQITQPRVHHAHGHPPSWPGRTRGYRLRGHRVLIQIIVVFALSGDS
jgi:hypothetical protein